MIITTKLHIPYIRTPIVERPRLLARLAEGLECSLTLVTAPAGYGKTTLLSQWASTSSTPTSWVSLDAQDNQFIQFWSHTLAAMEQRNPLFDAQKILSYYHSDPSGAALIASLINELQHLPREQVLIWDDFHVIDNQQVLDSIVYLLQRMPAHIHLYIASRVVPPLPLVKLNIKGELTQLTVDDLRFSLEEVEEYVHVRQLRQLSTLETAKVLEETEGWIVGLCLATMSGERMYQGKQLSRLTADTQDVAVHSQLTADKRQVANYFWEEVFSKQPIDVQHFLLKTSMLEKMNPALCTAVTGLENSAAILQRLEQEQLFIIPLDGQGEWYRYHHLFQQFLRRQLQVTWPGILHQLHLAAGHWLAEHQLEQQAVEHFLACACYEQALSCLQRMIPRLKEHERVTLHQWLNRFPPALLFQNPMLYLTNLASLFLSGRVEEATEKYWWAMNQLEKSQDSMKPEESNLFYAGLSFLVAFRGYLEQDFTTCLTYSKEYLTRDPAGNLLVGFGMDKEGYHPLWDIHTPSGHLPWKEQVLQELLRLWSATNNVYFVAHLCIDYGKLLYEWNRLQEAKHYLEWALQIGESHENLSLVVITSVWLARIDRATGAWSVGQSLLAYVENKVNPVNHPRLVRLMALHWAQLQRMQGMVKQVETWVFQHKLTPTDEISYSMLDEYELLAYVLAEKGELERALTLTKHLLQIANRTSAQPIYLRLLLRQSLLLAEQGMDTQSMDCLEEAFCLGEKNGYLRSLVDEGPALLPLIAKYIHLRQQHHRQQQKKVSITYVKKVFYLLSTESSAREDVYSERERYADMLSSLTAQESKVLQLIQTGMKNKEIASHLGISLSTVKTHINHIYRKLQVDNRFMAIQRAKELGLLDEGKCDRQ